MDHEQFDQLARGLAAGASRRGMVRRLSGAAIGGVLVAIGAGQAEGRKNKRGGGKAKGKGKGKGKPVSQGAKVTICHRTDSETHPFQVISVAPNAVAAHEAHGDLVGCPNLQVIDFETCTCVCPVADIVCESGQQLDPATCACGSQPECLPAECSSQNNACKTCSCRNVGGGSGCVCQNTTCPSGDCDPVTGCQSVAEVCVGKTAANPCFERDASTCNAAGTCNCGTDLAGNVTCFENAYCLSAAEGECASKRPESPASSRVGYGSGATSQ